MTSIGNGAFGGCSNLTSITIPNSVTNIDNSAFLGCNGLTSVTIECPNVGSSWFNGLSSINQITLGEKVTSIGDWAFYGCSGLTSVTIGKSVTRIGNYAFYGCSGLTSINITDVAAWCNITFSNNEANPLRFAYHLYLNGQEIKNLIIPEGVTNIKKLVFYGCSSLTSLTIPNNVTRIGQSAFYGCSSLTSVAIGNGVKKIEDEVFYGCSSMTSVTIGNSVTNIGWDTFGGCSSLADVYCYAENVPSTDSDAFEDTPISSATLHVPATSLDEYRTTEPWSSFGTILAIEEDQSNVIACADIAARSGQQVELPILLTNDADLTVVGISFTLKLPEGVSIAKDEYDDPLYSLESTRLNPKRFNVYTSQYTDGSWGFRISTNNTTAVLNGTEGVFMTLTLNIADSMAEGDYSISLTENKLSVKNSDNIVSNPLSNTTSKLTINNIIMGDVNGDGEVDLSDAIMVTYYSLNVVLPNFITAAADMNNDREIDLSDAITIIYKSLGVQFGSKARYSSRAVESNNDYLQLSGEGSNFGIVLSNEGSYLGFQCDIKLPAGATLNSIDLNDSRAANHTLMYNQLEDGSYRVAAFSASGNAISGNLGELLSFTMDGTAQGEVSIKNIFFVDTELRKVAFGDLSAIATGINCLTPTLSDSEGEIYNLAGQRLNKMQRGINIVNGKKRLVKIE